MHKVQVFPTFASSCCGPSSSSNCCGPSADPNEALFALVRELRSDADTQVEVADYSDAEARATAASALRDCLLSLNARRVLPPGDALLENATPAIAIDGALKFMLVVPTKADVLAAMGEATAAS